jgi:hypothetical protein
MNSKNKPFTQQEKIRHDMGKYCEKQDKKQETNVNIIYVVLENEGKIKNKKQQSTDYYSKC